MRNQATRPNDGVLRDRLKALEQERRRFGYRRLRVMLRRKGRAVNRKRVQRLYREEKPSVRRRGRSGHGHAKTAGDAGGGQLVLLAGLHLRPTDRWPRFRILTVDRQLHPRVLALVAAPSLSGA